MARVIFTGDFDYKPTRMSTIAYKAGWSGAVRRECAGQAVSAGKAEWVKPRAESEPADGEQ